MRRREFITLLGGAAAWVSPARAQEPRRVIGLLCGLGLTGFFADIIMPAFVQGLKDAGFVEGRNISIEIRINAWVDAEHAAAGYADRQEVMQEWLRLKRLLENAAKRANRACDEAAVLDTPEKRGRPTDHIADLVTMGAANVYEELTERLAVRSIDREGKPCGEFHHFLVAVFGVLDIKTSPDSSNMRLQTELRQVRSLG